MACNRQFYSLEFFPPHAVEGARSLVARMDRLASSNPPPLSVDITWTLSAGKRSFETLVAQALQRIAVADARARADGQRRDEGWRCAGDHSNASGAVDVASA